MSDHLGASHLTRAEWLHHNTPLAIEFYNLKDNQFASYSDATYPFCNKRTYNAFQRKMLSAKKKKTTCETICCMCH